MPEFSIATASSERRSIDVLGLGCVACDQVLHVAEYPARDAKVPILQAERRLGGQTGTALVAAARLGARAAYAGVLGEDDDSAWVLRDLQAAGVDVSFAGRQADARPIRATIVVAQADASRTVLYDTRGAVGPTLAWPPPEVLQQTRVLLVDQLGLAGMARAAQLVRAAGGSVVGDFESDASEHFATALAAVDHLIVSHEFAARLTGNAAPEQAALQLARDRQGVVVVTHGAQGCWYAMGPRPFAAMQSRAFVVEAVDTTGCGDVFHGAYAALLARGAPLEERLRWAAAAAALQAMRPGSASAAPTLNEVAEFLQRCV